MINKEINERIMITLSKKQAEWLRKKAKQNNTTVSKFIAWLMVKNIGNYLARENKKDREIIETIAKEPVPSEEDWAEILKELYGEEEEETDMAKYMEGEEK